MMTKKGHDFDVTVVIIAKCKTPGCKCAAQIVAETINRGTAAGAELWAQVKKTDADPRCPPCPFAGEEPAKEPPVVAPDDVDLIEPSIADINDARAPTPEEVDRMFAAATAAEDEEQKGRRS